MATFTQPVRLANFYLMVPKPKPKNDFGTKLKLIFMPFTEPVWLIAALLVVALSMLLVFMRLPELRGKAATTGHEQRKHALRSTVLDAMQDNLHETLLSFLGNGVNVDPEDIAAVKMVKSGIYIGAFLLTTLYSSQITAFLIVQNYDLPITGMDSCVQQRCTVCMTAYLESEMRAIYSSTINYRVEQRTETALSFFSWGYQQIRDGQCDAALIDETGYEENVANQACDMMFVGSVALQIYTGFAINPDYADAVSYWMRQLSWSAEASYLEAEHRKPLIPPMECNPRPNLNAPSSDLLRLGLFDLIGPFILIAMFVAVGLMLCLRAASNARVRPGQPTKERVVPSYEDEPPSTPSAAQVVPFEDENDSP